MCPCTSVWHGSCTCTDIAYDSDLKMLHHADVSYYPNAGFFRVGRRLYSARSMNSMGYHFWLYLVETASYPGIMSLYSDSKLHAYFMLLRAPPGQDDEICGVQFYIRATLSGLMPIVHVWRIQRAMRGWLRRRWEKRALATMMAWHVRLGDSSVMASLPSDVIRQDILVHL